MNLIKTLEEILPISYNEQVKITIEVHKEDVENFSYWLDKHANDYITSKGIPVIVDNSALESKNHLHKVQTPFFSLEIKEKENPSESCKFIILDITDENNFK